ncbi:MAG: translation initiation factor eIF-1A [Theionarchaea archaeon]|nr:translation initiation factor eIF-1A [Theionarchaea archaeon]MBU7001344.1 translation initiation factor eIF-1A [Theionarchaea archaeon]MBU7019835.1 translation initiation factor eIF-1A [Theionarchaea archaeon]MBU7035126.1 translation initiation factor eIF-1A [Theionarchaea archaeon]MBU7041869.1 translation initiation factor eIF-1A [Theionarchaea archaeon]
MAKNQQSESEQIGRIRLPKGIEVIGKVVQMMGYGKMTVKCTDGKVRLCRIPGRFRNRLWIRVNNIVLVKPWELAEEERGDIIYRYSRAQAQWLEKKKKIRL